MVKDLDADEVRETSRRGLLGQIVEATARSGGWAMRLGDLLREHSLLNNDLWSALAEGWQRSPLTAGEWEHLLGLLLTVDTNSSLFVPAASRLLEVSSQRLEGGIPIPLSDLAVQLATRLWAACVNLPNGGHEKTEDWLFAAINHPAGWLVECSVSMLSRENQDLPQERRLIATRYQEFFESVLNGDSHAAELGRVIVANRLSFLFSLNQGWAVSNVVPLLSWSEDPKRARQAWHGYLHGGNWTNALLPHLMPCFEETFPRLQSDFNDSARQVFCQYVAGIVSFSSADLTRSEWLNHFIAKVQVGDRVTWAWGILDALQQMDDPARERAWGWLRHYWRDRIEGVPSPLGSEEVGKMVGWSVGLAPVFPSVVDMILASPYPNVKNSFTVTAVLDSDLPARLPESLARLVLYLLRNRAVEDYEFEPVAAVLRKLATIVAARSYLLDACQELASMGYVPASSLRNQIVRNH